jgi:cyclic pyranopterin phosphate synthase
VAKRLTHFDKAGKAAMVDVAAKKETARVAVAKARVLMRPSTLKIILAGAAGKGDVLGVARLAGIMAAKRTADLIPLCHPLALAKVAVDFQPDIAASAVEVTATCKLKGRTGVEMEALTAAAIAALTIYDMCKAVDRAMTIAELRLVHKSGGKSGTFTAA